MISGALKKHENGKSQSAPFRHEFYALALRVEGDGVTKTGHS
jgi:hypothetical protein